MWGNVIIVKHDPLASNGRVYYTRYGHSENLKREARRSCHTRATTVASRQRLSAHTPITLHFDVSPTKILETNPEHWPAKNLDLLLANYVDPRDFRPQEST